MPDQIQWFTDFGDQAVILPIICAVAFLFACLRWWRGAGAWLLANGAVLFTMLALKLIVGACGAIFPFGEMSSPSGHTAAAAILYGGLGSIFIRRLNAVGSALLAFACALSFGASRILLGDHTIPEVVIGGTVGVAGAIMLHRLMGPPPERLYRGGLIILVLIIAWATHGYRLPAEKRIHAFAVTRLAPIL